MKTIFRFKFKNIFCGALAFVLLFFSPAAEPGTGSIVVKNRSGEQVGMYRNSYALVLAVDEYAAPWTARPGALRDAGEFKRVLENLAFDVTLVANPETSSLRKLLVDFINRYGQVEDNRLLIYFSGHCYNLVPRYGADEMEYLVPARAPDPGKDLIGFRESALSFFHVDIYARNIRSRHVLFLFEGCRKSVALALRDGGGSKEISRSAFNPARQFILLGGPEKPGADFRRAFLGTRLMAALKGEADLNTDGYVTASELAGFLRRENREHPGNRETLIYGELQGVAPRSGDFIFPLPPPPDKPKQSKITAHTDLPKDPAPKARSEKTGETFVAAPQPMPTVVEELVEEKHDRTIFWPPDEAERKKPFAIHEETLSRLQDLTVDEDFLVEPRPSDSPH